MVPAHHPCSLSITTECQRCCVRAIARHPCFTTPRHGTFQNLLSPTVHRCCTQQAYSTVKGAEHYNSNRRSRCVVVHGHKNTLPTEQVDHKNRGTSTHNCCWHSVALANGCDGGWLVAVAVEFGGALSKANVPIGSVSNPLLVDPGTLSSACRLQQATLWICPCRRFILEHSMPAWRPQSYLLTYPPTSDPRGSS